MHTMQEQAMLTQPTDLVVHAVAAVRDIDPIDLRVPLFEAVDPDALDALFESNVPGLSVTFRYHGHDVEVTKNGVVVDGTRVEPEV